VCFNFFSQSFLDCLLNKLAISQTYKTNIACFTAFTCVLLNFRRHSSAIAVEFNKTKPLHFQDTREKAKATYPPMEANESRTVIQQKRHELHQHCLHTMNITQAPCFTMSTNRVNGNHLISFQENADNVFVPESLVF
jgi:hypothetical protein